MYIRIYAHTCDLYLKIYIYNYLDDLDFLVEEEIDFLHQIETYEREYLTIHMCM